MEFVIPDGVSRSLSLRVEKEHTAKSVGSGGIDVFSTPSLVALLEQTALEAVQEYLPEGWTTVGTRIEIEHCKATLLGKEIQARATLTHHEGRVLIFSVEARDPDGLIGNGRHHRFIINQDKFLQKLHETAKNADP